MAGDPESAKKMNVLINDVKRSASKRQMIKHPNVIHLIDVLEKLKDVPYTLLELRTASPSELSRFGYKTAPRLEHFFRDLTSTQEPENIYVATGNHENTDIIKHPNDSEPEGMVTIGLHITSRQNHMLMPFIITYPLLEERMDKFNHCEAFD